MVSRETQGCWALLGALLLVGSAAACGYTSATQVPPEERLCVLAAPTKMPDFRAVQAALSGAREELARYGALRSDEQYPCLRIELLRVDEVSIGVSQSLNPNLDARAEARGVAVAVTGRGWVESAAGAAAARSRDTADVRRAVRLETTLGIADASRHDAAVAAAAERTGRAIARSALGWPTPVDDVP